MHPRVQTDEEDLQGVYLVERLGCGFNDHTLNWKKFCCRFQLNVGNACPEFNILQFRPIGGKFENEPHFLHQLSAHPRLHKPGSQSVCKNPSPFVQEFLRKYDSDCMTQLQQYTPSPAVVPGRWFQYDIAVTGNHYQVTLTDTLSNASQKTTIFDNPDTERGQTSGVQSYPNSPVKFRDIWIREISRGAVVGRAREASPCRSLGPGAMLPVLVVDAWCRLGVDTNRACAIGLTTVRTKAPHIQTRNRTHNGLRWRPGSLVTQLFVTLSSHEIFSLDLYNRERSVSLRILLSASLAILALPQLCAQTGSLSGRVSDQSGAVVQNATITLTSPDGRKTTAISSSEGAYGFTSLRAGEYTVDSSAPDLKLAEPVRIVISTRPVTLDLELRVILATQNLAVRESTGGTVSTEASANASATVITGKDLDALAEDPNDLATDLQALAGPSAGPNGSQIFVDGFSGAALPSKDSIREVRINQNPFSPEFEKLGLGRIEVLTKPGTDKVRGSVFYNFAHDAWNSRNPYAAEKAPFFLREWGGNAGGPLGKRSAFFVDTRRDATDNGSIVNAVVLDPVSLRPNAFTDVFEVPQRAIRFSPRIDHQLNSVHSLTFRYSLIKMDVPGAGVGSFNLRSRAYDATTSSHTVQLSDTAVVGAHAVNQLRFQYFRTTFTEAPSLNAPAVQVSGSFIGGGTQVGNSSDIQNNFELQNYLSVARGSHTMRFGGRLRATVEDNASRQNFGGTFIFSGGTGPLLDSNDQPVIGITQPIQSIEQYRRTVVFQGLGYTPARIRELGGGPTQFTISTGQPSLSANQIDVGVFAGDEWRVRPNLTLSLGLRYEAQSNINDWRDIAPRFAIAWAPGARNSSTQGKTVLRAGFGMFYDRFLLANTLSALRYNGAIQRQFVIRNPDFFPNIPDAAAFTSMSSASVIEKVSGTLRAPYLMQSLVSVERALPRKTTVALTYANSRGVHMLRSRNVNAPLPGTFQANDPATGVYPFGQAGPLFLMESSGIYNQNQLLVTVNTNATSKISLTGSYALNRAQSDTDGINTFPANQYDLRGEYGPAATDIRHRASLAGTIDTIWGVRLNPLAVIESGPPFNIVAGQDIYGTTLLNARPALARDPSKPGLILTSYGLLDPNPQPGDLVLSRNYGRGPGSILINLRVTKTIALGRLEASAPSAKPTRPWTLAISMSIRNLINHTNPGPIIGNITSPLFGQANQAAGSRDLGGGGFSEAANNRRLELQVRFTF